MQLVCDGSFEALLTCIFEFYERRLTAATISRQTASNDLFDETVTIHADADKAERVWQKLKNILSKESLTQIYWAFLSEQPAIGNHILNYVRYALSSTRDVTEDYSHASVLHIYQTWKKVGREKHRFEAFVRFELIGDNFFYAPIEPDFNVLPLIVPHFKRRYPAQHWIIYDLKRNYGMHYDAGTGRVEETVISFENHGGSANSPAPDLREAKYQDLWKNYFKSVNIPARKNSRLHLQHVPKRYWKYLTEKI